MEMSKLTEKYEALSGLDDKQKRAIIDLIDIKTDIEMQAALSEFRAEFAKLETTISSVEKKIESKISSLEKLVWGILVAVALAVVSKYLG
jgi:hypothetical protein